MPLSHDEAEAFSAFERSGWENAANPYHHHWGSLSRQSVEPMLDAAGAASGCRLLDIATGAGYAAAAAARRGCEAVGVDFSQAQVDLARMTYPEIDFRQGDAQKLDFEAGSFDSVVMGFGANHLPDPDAAFGEIGRVLKPGGRFAFTVWDAPRAGTGFGIILSLIETLGVAVSLPPAPPYFRFADADEVLSCLEQAGFVDIQTTTVAQHWHHVDPDHLYEAFAQGAVRATAMLTAQPEKTREAIRAAAREQVEALKKADRYIIPVPAALSSGRKA